MENIEARRAARLVVNPDQYEAPSLMNSGLLGEEGREEACRGREHREWWSMVATVRQTHVQ